MILSKEQLSKLNETIEVSKRRLSDPNTSAEHKKVFQNALTNAQNHINAHNAAMNASGQKQSVVEHAAPAQQYQQPKATLKPDAPIIKTAEIEVEIKTPPNRVAHQQMVVVEAKEGGDIALHLPAVSGATITITTPDGEKKS